MWLACRCQSKAGESFEELQKKVLALEHQMCNLESAFDKLGHHLNRKEQLTSASWRWNFQLSNPSWSEDSTDSKDEAVRHFENSDGAHVRYQTHRLPYGRMFQSFRQDLAGVYGVFKGAWPVKQFLNSGALKLSVLLVKMLCQDLPLQWRLPSKVFILQMEPWNLNCHESCGDLLGKLHNWSPCACFGKVIDLTKESSKRNLHKESFLRSPERSQVGKW